jgi:iron complex transport system substrate-binding protein
MRLKRDHDLCGKGLSRRNFLQNAATFGLTAAASGVALPSRALADNLTGERQTVSVVDSLTRTVDIPSSIDSVVPSGAFAQSLLTTLCPEKIKAVANEVSDEKLEYAGEMAAGLLDLSAYGGMYDGGDDDINPRKIHDMNPDVIIDVGDFKDNMQSDIESLENRTDVSTISVNASFGKLPQAYRTLGDLLGCAERADLLAQYVEDVFEQVRVCNSAITQKKSVLLAEGESGLSVRCPGSFQALAIEFVGAIAAVDTDADVGSMDVTMDDITAWNPDYVIFSEHACFESVLYCKDEVGFLWSLLSAIRERRFFEIPSAFYSWFGSPPLFIQTIGLLWLGNLIYPEVYDFDINEKAREFYGLFLGRELSVSEAGELVVDITAQIIPKVNVMILDGEGQ